MGTSVLSPLADDYFRVAHVSGDRGPLTFPATFGVLVVTRGQMNVSTHDDLLTVQSGDTVLVSHGCGDLTLEGDGSVVAVLPPAAAA